MRAVAMVLQVRLRQHWTSWLALAALVALAGGFVMAAASTGRRTAAAFPGFVARHGYDAIVYSGQPLPGLARIPQVGLVTPVQALYTFAARCVSCGKPIDMGSFSVFEVAPRSLTRVVKLLSGRMPDQSSPGEALASYTLARDSGVHTCLRSFPPCWPPGHARPSCCEPSEPSGGSARLQSRTRTPPGASARTSSNCRSTSTTATRPWEITH
jgi:hypothetical protein